MSVKDFYRTESGTIFRVTKDPEGHLSVELLEASAWRSAPTRDGRPQDRTRHPATHRAPDQRAPRPRLSHRPPTRHAAQSCANGWRVDGAVCSQQVSDVL